MWFILDILHEQLWELQKKLRELAVKNVLLNEPKGLKRKTRHKKSL